MKKILSLILIVAMLFSFSSCSKIKSLIGGDVSQTFSYPVSKMPATLDPQVASEESELIIIENCMEGLVRTSQDGSVIPAIAKSWSVSADSLQYTFVLNENAKWYLSDENKEIAGENFDDNITADDFVFAIKRAVSASTFSPDYHSVSVIKNADAVNSGKMSASSLGVRASGKYTLEITLESKNDGFIQSLTNAVFMPCNRDFFNLCNGRYGKSAKYFLNNGGYALSAWGDNNVVFKNNDEYKGTNPAKGDSVTIYEDSNAFANFQAGNYDGLAITYEQISYALAEQSLTTQSYADTVWSLVVNCSSDLGKYADFRKSLMMSFENSDLDAPKWAKEASGLIPDICTVGTLNYRKNAGKISQIKFNPEKGKEMYVNLLEKLEKTSDEEEIDSKTTFCCTKEFETTAKLIIQDWQKNIGTSFEAKISVLSSSELESVAQSGKYDVAILPVSATNSSALSFIKNYSTTDNIFGFKSQEFNNLLASAQQLGSIKKAEQYLINSAVAVPLFSSDSYYVQRKNVSGIYFYAFGGKVNFLNAVRVK